HALWSAFAPFFNKIPLWIWGHEHNQQLFWPGQFGLARGALVGASAYEERIGDAGLKAIYSMVQLADDYPTLGTLNNYFDHGYAIIDLGESGADRSVALYSFPSWGKEGAPAGAQSQLITRETLASPAELGSTGWPPPANLKRYTPLGMAPGHKNRLWVSGK